jgi:AraC family transcriptional regulator, arabinose operon regulatory protein
MDYLAMKQSDVPENPVSITSDWPLDNRSVRLVSPVVIRRGLEEHPLACDCLPLAVGYYEAAHGHNMSRQRHDDNILIYCFAGKGWLNTDSWQGAVSSGELLVLPSGVRHRYWADKQTPWSIYWCHFSGTLAGEYVQHLRGDCNSPVVPLGQAPGLIAQFQTLLQTTGNGYDLRAMVHAACMLKQLLTYIAVLVRDKSSSAGNDFDVQALQALMLQNLDKALDLDYLASHVGLSKYHFSKRYKQATGFSPIQHLIRMKVEYARYLLQTSDTPIAEIATKVGYDDALYFSRQFKRVTGCSPRTFRQQSML